MPIGALQAAQRRACSGRGRWTRHGRLRSELRSQHGSEKKRQEFSDLPHPGLEHVVTGHSNRGDDSRLTYILRFKIVHIYTPAPPPLHLPSRPSYRSSGWRCIAIGPCHSVSRPSALSRVCWEGVPLGLTDWTRLARARLSLRTPHGYELTSPLSHSERRCAPT